MCEKIETNLEFSILSSDKQYMSCLFHMNEFIEDVLNPFLIFNIQKENLITKTAFVFVWSLRSKTCLRCLINPVIHIDRKSEAQILEYTTKRVRTS